MISQSTTHAFHFDGDVLNVMYFDHDESLYIDDENDNAVQVHGVKPEHLIQLCRNFICGHHIDMDNLKDYKKQQLREMRATLNHILKEEEN